MPPLPAACVGGIMFWVVRLCVHGRIQDLSKEADHGERVERENGVPPAESRGRVGVTGAKPP